MQDGQISNAQVHTQLFSLCYAGSAATTRPSTPSRSCCKFAHISKKKHKLGGGVSWKVFLNLASFFNLKSSLEGYIWEELLVQTYASVFFFYV